MEHQGELRTPMAWQHRNNMTLQMQHQHSMQYPGMGCETGEISGNYHRSSIHGETLGDEMMVNSTGISRQSPTKSAMNHTSHHTDTSTNTSTEEDHELHYNHEMRHPMSSQQLGTMRSYRSNVTTWNGEPCPVHHGHPVPMPMTLPMPLPPMQCYPMMPPPAVLLPPMLRPRPLVMPADNGAPLEPLPVRDPMLTLPHKDNTTLVHKSKPIKCCHGHIIVFWIILCIILTGFLLGLILRFVIA